MSTEVNILSLAQKKRHAVLLAKLNEEKGLNKAEIVELAKYEKKPIKKTEPKKVVVKALSAKEEIFAREYAIDCNAARASRAAGYGEGTADKRSYMWVAESRDKSTKPHVWDRVQELLKKRHTKIELNADKVLQEIARLAFFDIGEIFDGKGNLKNIQDIPEDARRAISSVEVLQEFEGRGEAREYIGDTRKVKTFAKDKALELLAKHFSLLVDRVQHEFTFADFMKLAHGTKNTGNDGSGRPDRPTV